MTAIRGRRGDNGRDGEGGWRKKEELLLLVRGKRQQRRETETATDRG